MALVTVSFWFRENASEAVTTPFDAYHCFLRDPSGYRIEIQRFDDSDRSGPRPGVS